MGNEFEIKMTSAVYLFAATLQNVMEKTTDALGEKIGIRAETENISVEDISKEICKHAIESLAKEFGLEVTIHEVES